ncbi:hypothetical protein AZE42_05011 [Rhizopogon vesiculosus]|uniref:DUF6532 domain-containing protein n=1 Tax=Rhizopogon vesiculosus TaxID=180088 RepID=A0A1J8PN04_9AGAM|nr:hypothetical protein AZE42_05011 [Rhizopogon vesiculosus]
MLQTSMDSRRVRSNLLLIANITLARDLKRDSAFVYKMRSPDGNKGLYGAKIVQKGIDAIWFRDKKDDGGLFSDAEDANRPKVVSL